MQAQTIEQVIDELGKIIEWSRVNKSRAGYFPALYRRVTIEVYDGICNDRFENGPRMEELDIRFANRYLKAWDQYQKGEETTRSWKLAFNAVKSYKLVILQHLMLGMNAHINLDLSIAAAETAPGDKITGLENDFNAINSILSVLVDDVQKQIAGVSPWFRMMDMAGLRKDERIADFSMKRARNAAWKSACKLAPLSGEDKDDAIRKLDRKTALFGKIIKAPSLLAYRVLLRSVGLVESKHVGKILDALTK